MKTSENIANRQERKTKFLLKSMQFIALLLMGIELGVSYSHLMQLPGKSQLSVAMFIAVQTVLIQYKIGLGIVEIGSFLAMVVILWLVRNGHLTGANSIRPTCPSKTLTFRLTLGALLMLIAAFSVWGVFIEPINAAVDTWTASSFPDNWTLYRDRWHLFHIVRLILLTVGASSLIGSVLFRVDNLQPTKEISY
jgi:hypothetical protein